MNNTRRGNLDRVRGQGFEVIVAEKTRSGKEGIKSRWEDRSQGTKRTSKGVEPS